MDENFVTNLNRRNLQDISVSKAPDEIQWWFAERAGPVN
jgi:hypothetical protein